MPREDVATDEPTDLDEGGEIDELAGEELFDVPPDDDEDGTQAPTGTDSDSAPGAPPDKTATGDKLRDRETGKYVEKATEPPTGQPPEAKAPADPSDPTTDSPAAADGEDPDALEFSFRADGQQIPIPGSRLTKDRLEIPAEYVPEIQRLLSFGRVYQGSYKARLEAAKREVAEVKSQVHAEVEESKAVLSVFKGLLEQGPNAVQEWLDDFDRNRVSLDAEMKLAHAKALRERAPVAAEAVELPGLEPEADDFLAGVDRDELIQTVGNHLTTSIRELVAREQIRGLTAADVTRIHGALLDPEELNVYFGVATEDAPEQGITKGMILLDEPKLVKRLKYEAGVLAEARKGTAAAVAADKKNSAGGTGQTIPPTTAATGSGAPKKAARPLPKTKEEMKEWLMEED